MPDRIQREIEEILERLDDDEPRAGGARKPISIVSRRKRGPIAGQRLRRQLDSLLRPGRLLITGAIVMVAGFIVANAWEPLIWVSFAGVVLFLAAFVSTFVRRRGGSSTPPPASRGGYWRDRYIAYESPSGRRAVDRIKRRFRKR